MNKNETNKLRQYLSPFGVFALSLGTAIGWGSLVVTCNTYLLQAGPVGSVIGILLGALAMIFISTNYAYLINKYPEAGGAYTYIKEVFGHDQGFLCGWFLALAYLAIFWANDTSLPLFAHYFLGDVFRFGKLYSLFGYDIYLGEALLSLFGIVFFGFVCMANKKISSRLMQLCAIVIIFGISVIFFSAIFHNHNSYTPFFVSDTSALSQITWIAVISPWAFIGFENISNSAEEFSFKTSKVFGILMKSLLIVSVIYIFIILLSVTAYPVEYNSWYEYICDLGNLDGIKALPAFYVADYYMGHTGITILMFVLFSLIITSMIGNMTALSRLFYAAARDKLISPKFSDINKKHIPYKAVMLIMALSLLIPFVGRTAIGWIVDVTTICAIVVYGFVSAATMKLAGNKSDKLETITGFIGLLIMICYGLYILIPNLISVGSFAKETYFLFIVWCVLGFVFFRVILQRDKEHKFGKSIIVWTAFLSFSLFIALIWMRQSMIVSNIQLMKNIREHYETIGERNLSRVNDELFIENQIQELDIANTKSILMVIYMFVFALIIMLTNYSYFNKRTKASEIIANTDSMTGVRSKHAYITYEKNLNSCIEEGIQKDFAVVVCDVNGLKYVNDNFGHKAGDEYIKSASKLICNLFKHSPVFRIGGDEFVIIVSGSDFNNRHDIMVNLLNCSMNNIGTNQVVIAAGISDYNSEKDKNVFNVFERADEQMYIQKEQLHNMGARKR